LCTVDSGSKKDFSSRRDYLLGAAARGFSKHLDNHLIRQRSYNQFSKMFNLADGDGAMQIDDPPVAFSSFRPVPPSSMPHEKLLSTPTQTLTPPDNNVEAVCAELPKKLQLGKAIWHSEAESPEDFWDEGFEVKETRCYSNLDDEGVFRSPSWSPLSPWFPKHVASAAGEFTTPQIVETQRPASTYDLATEPFLNAWLGTNVAIEAEWTIEPSEVYF
jgi:hypothetical protein